MTAFATYVKIAITNKGGHKMLNLFAKKKLSEEVAELEARKEKISAQLSQGQSKLEEVKHQYNIYTNSVNVIEKAIDYNIPLYNRGLSELEQQRYGIQLKIKSEINIGLYRIDQPYSIEGSVKQGELLQKTWAEGICAAFNSYVNEKEKSLTLQNRDDYKQQIINRFDKFQKRASTIGVRLNSTYAVLRMEEMDVNLAIKLKKKEEAAKIREERKRLREQEKLLEEIAREQERLEQERKSMDIAFAKALTDEERELIKAQMNDIDKRMDNLKYRREHNNAGWVYVISSPSLPGMTKIGCTRRLNPTIRVKELSSSSLPYAFRTHGFVFSDNCFELENKMHHYFDSKRVAPDREFFYITPQEAIDVLKNKFNQEVHFEDMEEDKDV